MDLAAEVLTLAADIRLGFPSSRLSWFCGFWLVLLGRAVLLLAAAMTCLDSVLNCWGVGFGLGLGQVVVDLKHASFV
jgi:hypothetical protein